MRGKAQRDGLMADRWVNRISGPIFRRLWIKVHLVVSQFFRRQWVTSLFG